MKPPPPPRDGREAALRFLTALESLAADVRAIRVLLERETSRGRGRGRRGATADVAPVGPVPSFGDALGDLVRSVVDGFAAGR